jgi:hypothetical protein
MRGDNSIPEGAREGGDDRREQKQNIDENLSGDDPVRKAPDCGGYFHNPNAKNRNPNFYGHNTLIFHKTTKNKFANPWRPSGNSDYFVAFSGILPGVPFENLQIFGAPCALQPAGRRRRANPRARLANFLLEDLSPALALIL